MRDRVVCVAENWWENFGFGPLSTGPKKGEICTVIGLDYSDPEGVSYWLQEYPDDSYFWSGFRPVDDTFGEAVTERISEMIELEQTVTV